MPFPSAVMPVCGAISYARRGDLVSRLRLHAAEVGDRRALVALGDRGEEFAAFRYGELDRKARALAVFLGDRICAGDRVLLAFHDAVEFAAALLGCAYAGAVGVPVAVPRSVKHDRGAFARIASVVADCTPALALASSAVVADVWPHAAGAGIALPCAAAETVPDAFADDWAERVPSLDDLLLLQYTSGSTGEPRGVRVRHGNLVANLHEMELVVRFDHAAPFVNWLPHYHDMGLVGTILYPLYFGSTSYLMAPSAFLKRPVRWLDAISRYRAGSTVGPNFAYDLCVRRIAPEARAALDLSALTTAANGAEPIRPATLERFEEAFAPCGFARSAWSPSYGLAESTVFVSAFRSQAGPRTIRLASGARTVSCGAPAPGASVLVVDPHTRETLPGGELGELVIAGPSVTDGYWGHEPARVAVTTANGVAEYLPTGDIGAIVDGDLCILGRLKDLIIVDGRNHHAADVEASVSRAVAHAVAGGCAAFGADVDDAERLVVALEIERIDAAERDAIVASARAAVAEEHDVALHEVVLLRPGRLPRTSSGKVRRHRCREEFAAGVLR